jgi:hypothetical protein
MRMHELDAVISSAEIVHTSPELIIVCAELRAEDER